MEDGLVRGFAPGEGVVGLSIHVEVGRDVHVGVDATRQEREPREVVGDAIRRAPYARDLRATHHDVHRGAPASRAIEQRARAQRDGSVRRRGGGTRGQEPEKSEEDGARHFAATNMISTTPSGATRPVITVARVGKSFVKISR